jgi:hypothetical protein
VGGRISALLSLGRITAIVHPRDEGVLTAGLRRREDRDPRPEAILV